MTEGGVPLRRSPENSSRCIDTPEAVPPLLYMTVDLGGGKQDAIVIYPEDKPRKLAQAFCAQKDLPAATCAKLEALIDKSKAAALHYRATRSLDYRPPVQPVGARPSVGQDTTVSRIFPSTSRYTRSMSSDRFSIRSDSAPRNYGEWLYQRDLITRHRKRVERQRKYMQDRHWSEEPKRKPRSRSEPKEDDLLLRGKEMQKKLRNMRKQALEEEMDKCPFRPTLNPRSKTLDQPSSESRFDKLFSDASSLSSRQQARTKAYMRFKCPFRPLTGSVRLGRENQIAIVDRLINSKKDFESAVSKLREELESSSVPSFRPVTGRGPSSSDSSRKGTVHEQLYENRLQREAKRKQLEQDYYPYSASQQVGANRKSEKIVEDYRKRQVEKLFERTGSDGDGVVEVSSTEQLKRIDERTKKLLGPVWKQLEGRKVALEEFRGMVESAMKSLSQEEKAYVLKHAGTPVCQSTPPSLNNSTSLAATPHRPEHNIYLRSVADRSESADKRRLLKEQKDAEEMNECTFRPRITKYHKQAPPEDLY